MSLTVSTAYSLTTRFLHTVGRNHIIPIALSKIILLLVLELIVGDTLSRLDINLREILLNDAWAKTRDDVKILCIMREQ